jgi:hypothetical protein
MTLPPYTYYIFVSFVYRLFLMFTLSLNVGNVYIFVYLLQFSRIVTADVDIIKIQIFNRKYSTLEADK